MKKLLLSLALILGIGISAIQAQETKVKPIITPSDKIHNVLHPHRKISHGVKYKHKYANGNKRKVKIKKDHPVPMVPKEEKKEN